MNANGYIESLKEDGDVLGTYTYDNGYLSKLLFDGGNLQCTWSNGDLVLERRTNDDPMDVNNEYTSQANKTNIDFFAFTWGYLHVDDPEFLGVCGLHGKKSNHLIKTATGNDGIISYSYESNSDGYPTKITRSQTPAHNPATTYQITYS